MTFGKWFKTLIFYEILMGMKATMAHLLKYRPILAIPIRRSKGARMP